MKREADPWCTLFPGQPCWKRSTPVEAAVPDKVRRDPAPGWCTLFPGQPCWKRDGSPVATKRTAEAAAEAEPDRYCTRFAGGSCWKRDNSAEASEEAKRCLAEGGACWQAKRAAAAVINTIDFGNAVKMARDAEAAQTEEGWKRAASCHGPAGVCTKATRDLHAMYNAARSIIEA